MLLLYHRLYISYILQIVTSLYLLYVAIHILVQSEEKYSLIWKAKPLTIQTDKGKW